MIIALLAGCSFEHGIGTSAFQDAPPALDDSLTEVDTAVAIDAAPDAHVCPSGFTVMAGGQPTSRYKFYGYSSASSIVNFAQASQTCTNEGGYVAIANDAAEIAAFDTIAQNPSQAGYWVGITDAEVEDTWRTVLGELATYLPWKAAQPNGGTGSNCAVGYLSELYDVDCAMATYVFICECTQ